MRLFIAKYTYRDEVFSAFVDDCDELADSPLFLRKIRNIEPENRSNSAWTLTPEILLKEVLEITHENMPEVLCCLSTLMSKQRCLLKIDETMVHLKGKADIFYSHRSCEVIEEFYCL